MIDYDNFFDEYCYATSSIYAAAIYNIIHILSISRNETFRMIANSRIAVQVSKFGPMVIPNAKILTMIVLAENGIFIDDQFEKEYKEYGELWWY